MLIPPTGLRRLDQRRQRLGRLGREFLLLRLGQQRGLADQGNNHGFDHGILLGLKKKTLIREI